MSETARYQPAVRTIGAGYPDPGARRPAIRRAQPTLCPPFDRARLMETGCDICVSGLAVWALILCAIAVLG